MNRQQAKELLPIIQAFAEGKTIQYQYQYTHPTPQWRDVLPGESVGFSSHSSRYRIKPKPTYRPFKNKEECWEEMQKHQPFGWVKYKDAIISIIAQLSLSHVFVGKNYTFKEAKDEFTFADGTPFGIKE
nr:MAG TPA: hypothetical protein [Crassvirales sp.]